MKWGDSRRDVDPILAVWSEYEPLRGFWPMQDSAIASVQANGRFQDRIDVRPMAGMGRQADIETSMPGWRQSTAPFQSSAAPWRLRQLLEIAERTWTAEMSRVADRRPRPQVVLRAVSAPPNKLLQAASPLPTPIQTWLPLFSSQRTCCDHDRVLTCNSQPKSRARLIPEDGHGPTIPPTVGLMIAFVSGAYTEEKTQPRSYLLRS